MRTAAQAVVTSIWRWLSLGIIVMLVASILRKPVQLKSKNCLADLVPKKGQTAKISSLFPVQHTKNLGSVTSDSPFYSRVFGALLLFSFFKPHVEQPAEYCTTSQEWYACTCLALLVLCRWEGADCRAILRVGALWTHGANTWLVLD